MNPTSAPTTYTPLQPNQALTYGTQGPAVGALQNQLNTQYASDPNFTPLKVDNKYGPLTQAAVNYKPTTTAIANTPNPGILSSTPARIDMAGANKQFNTLTQSGDPYDQAIGNLLQQQTVNNQTAEQNAIASATAKDFNQQQTLEGDKRQAQAVEATRELQTGEARNAPQYASEQMTQLSNVFAAKINALQNEEAIAIGNAKQARANNDLATYKESIQYIKDIRDAKAQALKDANLMAFEREKFAYQQKHDKQQMALEYAKMNQKITMSDLSPDLLAAIQSGQVDPNRLNSRTVNIYNAIAKNGINASASHASTSAKTKSYEDNYKIKSTATNLISILDKNMPLLSSLADKVNTSGVPGIDNMLNGVTAYTGNDRNLGKYINTLATIRAEYARMLARGNAVQKAELDSAADAVPAGKSGDFYRGLEDQLKAEGQNVISSADETLNGIYSNNTTNNNNDSTNNNDYLMLTPSSGLTFSQQPSAPSNTAVPQYPGYTYNPSTGMYDQN